MLKNKYIEEDKHKPISEQKPTVIVAGSKLFVSDDIYYVFIMHLFMHFLYIYIVM